MTWYPPLNTCTIAIAVWAFHASPPPIPPDVVISSLSLSLSREMYYIIKCSEEREPKREQNISRSRIMLLHIWGNLNLVPNIYTNSQLHPKSINLLIRSQVFSTSIDCCQFFFLIFWSNLHILWTKMTLIWKQFNKLMNINVFDLMCIFCNKNASIWTKNWEKC